MPRSRLSAIGDITIKAASGSISEEDENALSDGEKLDKDMQSMTYTGELIDSYLKALGAEYKDKSQKENREELKKQLLNIYGSWDKASAAIKKRQKQKQKK